MKSIKRIITIASIAALMVCCFAISANAKASAPCYIYLNSSRILNSGPCVNIIKALDYLCDAGEVTRTVNGNVTTYYRNGVLIYTADKDAGIGYGNIDATAAEEFTYEIPESDTTSYFAGESKIVIYANTTKYIDVSDWYAEGKTLSMASASSDPSVYDTLNVGMYLALIDTKDLLVDDDAWLLINKNTGHILITITPGDDFTLTLNPNVTTADNIYWTADDAYLNSIKTTSYDNVFFKSITFIHAKTEYKMEGSDTVTWVQGSTDSAVLVSLANHELFNYLTVDGKTLVKDQDFEVTKGSTKITFKPEYLKTLALGKHEVVINSYDGSAKGYLIVADDKIAQTGDNSAVGAFVAIATFSTLAFVSLKKKENEMM